MFQKLRYKVHRYKRSSCLFKGKKYLIFWCSICGNILFGWPIWFKVDWLIGFGGEFIHPLLLRQREVGSRSPLPAEVSPFYFYFSLSKLFFKEGPRCWSPFFRHSLKRKILSFFLGPDQIKSLRIIKLCS